MQTSQKKGEKNKKSLSLKCDSYIAREKPWQIIIFPLPHKAWRQRFAAQK
jgi:hypothetical protein